MGDCADGISGTGSKPGILKAGVGRGGLTPLLQKVLHATGRVAKETGLPLFCHHDPSTAAGGAILDLLASCGVPASRVILGHSGDTDNLEYLTAMLERGCWLGMDRFGFCDRDLGLEPRVDTIAALCRAGAAGEAAGAEEKKEPVKEQISTGNPELDRMIRDGTLAIREMKRLDENIADPGISADIVRLEQVSTKIFDEVKAHPEKLPQIRRFLDYYLPTTLKLLNAYDRMSGTGVSGENIDTTLAKVEGMMRTIVAAFEKQLDSLYGAEALDISTDITVLENMMAREGLVDSPLKAEPDEKKETDIRLEL